MTQPTDAADALSPITQERIEAQLDANNLKHFRSDEGMTETAFPGLVVFFQVSEVGFKATARWIPVVSGDADTRTARELANHLNASLPLVRTHAVRRDDATTVVLIEAPFFTTDGATDGQLKDMLDFYFSAIHHVMGQLDQALPHLKGQTPNTKGEA